MCFFSCILDVLRSEIESVSTAVRNPSVGQSDGVQRVKSSEPEAADLTSSHQSSAPTLRENNPEPTVSPRVQDADTAGISLCVITRSLIEGSY